MRRARPSPRRSEPSAASGACSASPISAMRAQQDGVRADLEERAPPAWTSRGDRLREAHRPAQVLVPVLRVERGVGHPLAGDRRQPRDRGRAPRDLAERGREHVAHGLDLGGVRGVVDRQPLRAHAAGLAPREQRGQRPRIAGDHRRAGAVDGRELESRATAREGELVRRQRHRRPWRRGRRGATSARLRTARRRARRPRATARRRRPRRRSRPAAWPTSAAGSTPCARHSSASADHHRAQRRLHDVDARARRVRRRRRARRRATSRRGGAPARRARREPRGERARSAASSSPMPAHCAPWPGTRTPPRGRRRRRARTRSKSPLGDAAPSQQRQPAARAGRDPRRSRPRGALRGARGGAARGPRRRGATWGGRRRPRAARSPGPQRRLGAGRDRPRDRQRGGLAFGRVSRGRHGARPVGGKIDRGRRRGSPSSRITCALVPLMPNDDTRAAARPAALGPRPGVGAAARTAPGRPVDVRATARRRAACAAACARRIASTILMTPATPAAAWVWPMFDLIEPSHSGRSAARPRP